MNEVRRCYIPKGQEVAINHRLGFISRTPYEHNLLRAFHPIRNLMPRRKGREYCPLIKGLILESVGGDV
jgi:hypothetical protein